MGQEAVGRLRHLLPHVRRSVRAAPRRLWQEGSGGHLVLRLPGRWPLAVLRHLGEGAPLVAALVQHVLRRLPAEVQPVRRPGLPPPPGPGLREPLLRDLDEVVSGPGALRDAGSRRRAQCPRAARGRACGWSRRSRTARRSTAPCATAALKGSSRSATAARTALA